MTGAPHIELDSRSSEAVDGRHIRAVTFQDIRMEYVSRVLADLDLVDGRALVVGSGRGLLARGLAGLGFEVVALDPSPVATEMARQADGGRGAAVVYETGPAEELGFEDATFDLVYCADTFEITPHLGQVIAEAARVLRATGVLLYDSVNRTLLSRLIYLGAFQALPMTRIMPPGRYSAARLRTPAELAEALGRNGLHSEDVCGFKPKDPRRLLTATLARRRGQITDEEIPPIVDFTLTPEGAPLVTYLGYALAAGS
jgi:2-polyprenyl-6-hydroxyphenyl methylase / 3-demethylubiquinone-9 3-methyltransferase